MSTASVLFAAVAWSMLGASVAAGATCPAAGGAVVIEIEPPPGAAPSAMNLSGVLVAPSCDDDDGLATGYSLQVDCANQSPCSFTAEGLSPGTWVHRIFVTGGESLGQLQARRALVLDRSAGEHEIAWPLFRTVATVLNTADSPGCQGCLRQALEASANADKPMLIGFNASTIGDILLADQLPELSASQVTIDALDFDGRPHRRTIDVNGMSRAGLHITGSNNHVVGLRITNVGGDSDMLLVDGANANANRIESVQIVGRTLQSCERLGQTGCIVRRECVIPSRLAPRGDCGDDGIAIRSDAGHTAANVLVDVDLSGAFDKGLKVSEGGVAVLERSWIHGNSDGGVQATLGGKLTATENRSEGNRGTLGANGLAANGPRIDATEPAILTTRGNLLRNNSLRGLSIRSLSQATIHDDFVCGNGTAGTGVGFGLAMLDAAGFSATADVRGVALVNNLDGGLLAEGSSIANLGDANSPGNNAIAFNGVASDLEGPTELRNLSSLPISAIGNHWAQCGPSYECSEVAVLIGAVFAPAAGVEIVPARSTPQLRAPVIREIRPSYASAGDMVWIYGENFDAVGAAAQDPECDGVGRPCTATDPNCVFVAGEGAEIVAATPTLLVIRAPFTCVEPVKLAARTRRSRGFARTEWCRIDE